MNLFFSKTSLSRIKRLDRKTRERIMAAIDDLPLGSDIKKMRARKIENLYRLRIGKYRVLYIRHDDCIRILEVDTRGDIY